MKLSELADEVLSPGAEVALFYFAGHALVRRGDLELAGQESHKLGSGFSLSDFLSRVHESEVPEITIILDCCYSGATGRAPQFGGGTTLIRSGVSVLSACRHDQKARAENGRGLFSSRLHDALEGGAADTLGLVTLAGMYAYLSESFGVFDQRPTFLTSTSKMPVLRRCSPAVPLDQLRQLPRIFSSAKANLALSPAYESSTDPHDPEKERDFEILQNCRDAKLVVPVGERHLYYAAIYSKSCRLTPLGRHYWKIASTGRL